MKRNEKVGITELRQVALELVVHLAAVNALKNLKGSANEELTAMIQARIEEGEAKMLKAVQRVPAEDAGSLRLRLTIAESRERLTA